MNTILKAQAGYGAQAAPTRTPRSFEYDVFARVTRALRMSRTDEATMPPPLARAINDNMRLWRTLALDLADDGNGLPPGLRADLLSLADFSLTHGSRILRGQAGVDALVEINTAIMNGLRHSGRLS